MRPRLPMPALPTCIHCERAAMHGCKTCFLHWQIARGWCEERGEYLEPFEKGPDDPNWTDEMEDTK